MNVSIRIAWACFLGAVVGGVFAHALYPVQPYLMAAGILLGGLVGYIAYNTSEAVKTAKAIWAKMPELAMVRKEVKSFFCGLLQLFGIGIVVALAIATFFGGVLSICVILLTESAFFFGTTPPLDDIWIRAYLIGGTVWMSVLAIFTAQTRKDDEITYFFIAAAPGVTMILWPLALIGIACAVIGATLWFCFLIVPLLVWRTFKAIHSEARLICATDSMIGALVGFYFSKGLPVTSTEFLTAIFLGGVIGALVGVVNYEIVSIRLLKLVPRTT